MTTYHFGLLLYHPHHSPSSKNWAQKKLSACHHRVPPCGPFKQPPQSPPMLLCTNMIATYIMYLFTAPPKNIFNVFISLFLGGGTCKSLPPPNQKDSSSSRRSVDFVKWRTTGSLTVINKRLQEASSSPSSSDHHHHHLVVTTTTTTTISTTIIVTGLSI